MRVLFYPSRKRMNRRGLVPLWMRITIKGHPSAQFSTGLFIEPGRWRCGNNQVRGGEVENEEIERLRVAAWNIRCVLMATGKPITPENIRYGITGNRVELRPTLRELFDRFMNFHRTAKEKNADSTLYRYKTRWKRIEDFLPGETDPETVSQIDAQRLAMEIKMNHRPSYGAKLIQLINQVYHFAELHKLVTKNPFAGVRIKRQKLQIIALEPCEVLKLMEFKFVQSRLQQIADLFLMQCFTGMAFADLMKYNPEQHLRGELIIFERLKMGKRAPLAVVPVIPQFRQLVDKYGGRPPRISNQKYNSYLKEIAEIVGIPLKLTTHIGRKTFAALFLDAGGLPDELSRILGHSDIRTTYNHYAQASNSRIRKAGENSMKIYSGLEPLILFLFIPELPDFKDKCNSGKRHTEHHTRKLQIRGYTFE